MGTHLELVLPEEQRTNQRVVDRYYDYVESKEREYFPDCSQEEFKANFDREISREGFEECGTILLYEQIISDIIYKSDLYLRDLFPSYYESIDGDRTIYEKDIKRLISRLREAKNQLKKQENEGHWEIIFELKLIAICGFALENGYGIELS